MYTTHATARQRRRSIVERLTGLWTLIVVTMAAVLTTSTQAQIPAVVTQFDVTGFIQQATLDRPGDVFSGGTITVNNVKYIVPYYTVLQMPAFALTWQELFAMAPAPYTGLQTGYAIQDIPKPKYNYEAHLVGNRLPDGRQIVGLMFLAQHSLHSGQGFITAVNFADGSVTVDGITRVRVNDPIGRFTVGIPDAQNPDVRFTIDEDNPTVRASSSYPMCIPRSAADPLCPQKNRPISPIDGVSHLGFFTMQAAASSPTAANRTDPFLMAPFEVGDWVTYNGLLVDDPIRGTYVLAHTLIAEATILTAPGTVPAYTAIDVLLQGAVSKAAPAGLEGAVRTRVEGWSTDAGGNTAVNVYAIDVDGCSGLESERLWNDHDPKTGVIINGPFTIDIDSVTALGRWRFRPSARDEAFLPPTRMLRARNTSLNAADHQVITTPNGLLAGEYTAPIFEFIFSEGVPPGAAPPPPNSFENLPFLVNGEGPYNGGTATTGQLSPWPSLVPPPTTVSCAAAPPPPPPPIPVGTAAPVAVADALGFAGATLSFSSAQLLANDTGTSISFVAVSPTSVGGGTIAGSGPFVFTPAAGFSGSDSFTYQIIDSFGQTALGVVTVSRTTTVTVPNVVNQTQAAAQGLITSAGLTNGAVTTANSATVAAGSIISQNPAAGSSVAPGTSVALVRSLGPALVTVPNVVNQTQAAAQSAITAAGLTNGVGSTANSATVAAGSVISQNPLGGASVAPGSAVTLVVSLGPALVTVPNVVNSTQAAAQSAIAAAGLTNGTVTTANSATVIAGSVISENPAAGTSVALGSAVTLVVSSGPAATGGNPTVQVSASSDGTGARTTPAFSTTTAGEVLIALVGSDGPTTGVNTQNITVSGAGLTWTRVQRAATSRGVSEIWTATAPTALANVTVTSTQSVTTVLGAPVNQSIHVLAFTNATGVGATTAASGVSTNATATLVTQAAGSMIFGVGNDFDRAVARTVGAGQTKLHEFLAPTGDTFWMQNVNAASTAAGQTITVNATAAGAADQWNLAIVEIKR
jgi:beta-lactam-binding protein with PASTA domain